MLTDAWFESDEVRYGSILRAILGHYGIAHEHLLGGNSERARQVFVRLLVICRVSPDVIERQTAWNHKMVWHRIVAAREKSSLREQEKTVVRVLITVVNSWLVTYTFTHLPLAQSYAIFFTMPLLITLLAWPFLGEPVDPVRGVVILVGFCGVLIALRPGEVTLQPGHLTAICGAVLGAVNSLILRKVGIRESTGVILIYPAVAQVLVTALVVHSVWHPMSGTVWQISLLQGFLSTLGGVLVIAAYRCATAIVVAPMQYSQVICAGILGAIFFDELIEPMVGELLAPETTGAFGRAHGTVNLGYWLPLITPVDRRGRFDIRPIRAVSYTHLTLPTNREV